MSLVGHIVDRFRKRTDRKAPDRPTVVVDLVGPCRHCAELERERSIARSEAGYWKAAHAKALEREAALRKQVEEFAAKVKLRERQLFGKKSERKGRSRRDADGDGIKAGSRRKRGQQRGAKGHGRRDNSHLPVRDELRDLPEDKQDCPCCGMPLVADFKTEDSEFLEVEVKAFRRRTRRRRYRKTCNCPVYPECSRHLQTPDSFGATTME